MHCVYCGNEKIEKCAGDNLWYYCTACNTYLVAPDETEEEDEKECPSRYLYRGFEGFRDY